MPGGKLVVADLNVHNGRLASVQISGDFFLEPDSALGTINRVLEGQLEDAGADELSDALRHALGASVTMYGISPEAVAVAVRRAVHGNAEA